jgi:hypothetical protein
MLAYERGWNDAEHGLSLSRNPFIKGTGEWIGWRNGWRELNASAFSSSAEVDELIRVQA